MPQITHCISGSRRVSLFRTLLVLAVMGGLGRSAHARNYVVYSVTLQGSVFDYYTFRRGGYLFVTTRFTNVTNNGLNPIEVELATGNPAGAPETGALWFMSNNGFLGSRSLVDLAYVSSVGSRITVTADSRVSEVGANAFTARPGLGATLYHPYSGGMVLNFTNSSHNVTGSVNLLGHGYSYSSGTPYRATLSGYYLRTITR